MICNTKQWKRPACTATGEEINKTTSIYAAGCSLTTSAVTWMNLVKMMLRERTQTPKATCGVIPRMSKVQDKQTCRDRKYIRGSRGVGVAQKRWEVRGKGSDENVLKSILVVVVPSYCQAG